MLVIAGGIPLEFLIFALTLAGIVFSHTHALKIAVGGMCVLVIYELLFSSFRGVAGAAGLVAPVILGLLGAHLFYSQRATEPPIVPRPPVQREDGRAWRRLRAWCFGYLENGEWPGGRAVSRDRPRRACRNRPFSG